MKRDIYPDLLKHLGKVGSGYPQNPRILKILRDNLTEAEAETALGLPVRLPPLEVEGIDIITARLGRPVEEVEEKLESLSKKGFLVQRPTPKGTMGYAFIQIGFGIPQLFFWKGEVTEKTKSYAFPLLLYLKAGGPEMKDNGEAKHFRYIPVSTAISGIAQAVLPYDRLLELVGESRRIALVHCACREQMRNLASDTSIFKKFFVKYIWGRKEVCAHTIENCMKFNDMADFDLEKGLGREITTAEAIGIIKKSEDEGLIHFVDNCKDRLRHLCNCCTCCCWQLTLIRNGWAERDDVMATYYQRDTEQGKCTGCGICVKDCPLKVIKLENKLPVVDQSKCVGCGLCLRRCRTKAAILVKRDDRTPFPDFLTLHQTAIQNVIGKRGG